MCEYALVETYPLNFATSYFLVKDFGVNPVGGGVGYGNCPDPVGDKAVCFGDFVVPSKMTGDCTLMWWWPFMSAKDVFTTCWEATVDDGSTKAPTITTRSPATGATLTPTTKSPTTKAPTGTKAPTRATKAPTRATTAASTEEGSVDGDVDDNASSNNSSDNGLSTAAIGVISGVSVGVVGLAIGFGMYRRRRHLPSKETTAAFVQLE